MARAFEMIRRMEAVNIKHLVADMAQANKRLFEVYNQFQLSAGKNRRGEYLPRYIDDPYFRTITEALAYQDWKAKISRNKEKPVEIMDFRIRGDFHESIKAEVMGLEVQLYSNSEIADDVQIKTGFDALGINPESARELWQETFLPGLLSGVMALTGIRSSTIL